MVTARTSRFFTIAGMEVHASLWGDPKNPAVICWHGLTRNGRDFDALAERLSAEYFVVCPDTIGRGLSQWSTKPEEDYGFALYAEQAVGLADALGIDKMRWVGTSMGGAIGIRLAGTLLRDRITHLVLNDIGAGPTEAALAKFAADQQHAAGVLNIIQYTANPPEFATFGGLVGYYRKLYAAFGLQTEEEWTAFASTSARRKDNGCFSPDYDPRIVAQFSRPDDLMLWKEWDAVTAATLVIRGERSDILLLDTAEEMQQRGPSCQLVELPGLGHAPALNTEEQMGLIEGFLRK